jgi:hypothetical protein
MAVLIKRYANRKLYNTQSSRYITLKGIADLLEAGEEVRVGGDALYEALSRGVDDASERLEDFQRTMRKLLRVRAENDAAAALDGDETGTRDRDWMVFSPPDLDQLVQRTLERVLKMLDLPTRSDIDALNARIDRLTEALGERVTPRPPRETPAPPAHVESDPD